MPRRTAAGTDYNRVNLLMAVLEKRLGMALSNSDAYVNIAGGIRMNEPAIDLGIVMALVSSYRNRPVDEKTIAYMEEHSTKKYTIYEPDEDAEYEQEFTIDLSTLKPTVAFPHLPENTHTIDEVGEIKIDQVVIGSCTNGRMDDLRVAASILKGHRVAKGLRVIVIPATQQIYLDAMEEGLLKTFIEAGAVVSTPTCGPCLGGYMGILAEHERCVSTTNRNFVGRMGHVESEIYLASPAVAAASAITGKLSGPDEIA